MALAVAAAGFPAAPASGVSCGVHPVAMCLSGLIGGGPFLLRIRSLEFRAAKQSAARHPGIVGQPCQRREDHRTGHGREVLFRQWRKTAGCRHGEQACLQPGAGVLRGPAPFGGCRHVPACWQCGWYGFSGKAGHQCGRCRQHAHAKIGQWCARCGYCGEAVGQSGGRRRNGKVGWRFCDSSRHAVKTRCQSGWRGSTGQTIG